MRSIAVLNQFLRSNARNNNSTISSNRNFLATDFLLTENPITQSGNWINGQSTGIDWSNCATTKSMVIGLQPAGGFNDAVALLTGNWGNIQSASAIVSVSNRISGSSSEEVELRLMSILTAHTCSGYEINFSTRNDIGAYAQVVRWNGKFNDFSLLDSRAGTSFIINTGDVVSATVNSGSVNVYIRGTLMFNVQDTSSFTTGSPGVGFFLDPSGFGGIIRNSDYGFTQFTASTN